MSLAACGEKAEEVLPEEKQEETEGQEEEKEDAPELAVEEEEEEAPEEEEEDDGLLNIRNLSEGDEGEGEVRIFSRFGQLYIPRGLLYEIDYIPDENEDIGDSLKIFLGERRPEGLLSIADEEIGSLEDAVKSCLRFHADEEGEDSLGDIVNLGGRDYQTVIIEDRYGFFNYILVSFYEKENGDTVYIEFDAADNEALLSAATIEKVLGESIFE